MPHQKPPLAALPSPVNPADSSRGKGLVRKDSASVSSSKGARSECDTEMFKVPFELECEKCGSKIAKSARLNATKEQIGYYRERKAWSFTSGCPHCGHTLGLESSLFGPSYEVMEGAREVIAESKKVERKIINYAAYREERSKVLARMAPSLSGGKRNFFEMFHVGLVDPKQLKFDKDVPGRRARNI